MPEAIAEPLLRVENLCVSFRSERGLLRAVDGLSFTVAPGEILTKVVIPPHHGKNATYEARQKQAHDWPLVLCSVCLEAGDGTEIGNGRKITKARVVLYGVAPIPWRSESAEKAITGKELTTETAEAAASAAVEGARPLSMNVYKITLAKTVVKRALLSAAGNRYWEGA